MCHKPSSFHVKLYLFACTYADKATDAAECWYKILHYKNTEKIICHKNEKKMAQFNAKFGPLIINILYISLIIFNLNYSSIVCSQLF